MLSTAKENIAKLPETIWSVLLMDKSLIMIRAGEMGYFPAKLPPNSVIFEIAQKLNVEQLKITTDHIADYLNAEEGKTKGMRKAMDMGSMFGYAVAGANLDNYTDNGELLDRKVEIKVGDQVWDTHNRKEETVSEIGVKNYFFTSGEAVGKEFCFKILKPAR